MSTLTSFDETEGPDGTHKTDNVPVRDRIPSLKVFYALKITHVHPLGHSKRLLSIDKWIRLF